MHLDQVLARFSKLGRDGVQCRLNVGAGVDSVRQTERRLNLIFPDQVVQFWCAIDGLDVQEPPFRLAPLSEFNFRDGLILFGTCETAIQLAFDVRDINEAGQWSIINAATGYRVTLTMASFWSYHMWTWIVKRRPIWYDVHSTPLADKQY